MPARQRDAKTGLYDDALVRNPQLLSSKRRRATFSMIRLASFGLEEDSHVQCSFAHALRCAPRRDFRSYGALAACDVNAVPQDEEVKAAWSEVLNRISGVPIWCPIWLKR